VCFFFFDFFLIDAQHTSFATRQDFERPFYLLLLDKIDRKRTFRNAATKLAKQHAVHKTLFMVRMHAMQTMKKDNLRVKAAKKGDIKNYLLAMYPDNKCHAHKKESELRHRQRMQGQVEAEYEDVFTDDPDPESDIPVEDTSHMLNCRVRESRKVAATTLWDSIRQKIRAVQRVNAPPVEYLRPFALRDASIVSRPIPPPPRGGMRSSHPTDPYAALRGGGRFPSGAGVCT